MFARPALRSLLCGRSERLIRQAPWPVPLACLLAEELLDASAPTQPVLWILLAISLPALGLVLRSLAVVRPSHQAQQHPDASTLPPEGVVSGWHGAAVYVAMGFTAGTFGSAVGLGGGVLLVPLLVSMGMQQARAHGTSLVSVTTTSIAGAYTYLTAGFVEPTAGALLALTAIPTAGLGAHFASKVHGALLKRFFGCWLLVASSLVLAKPYLPVLVDLTAVASVGGVQYWLSVGCLGLVAGFLSAFLGVGGGSLLVPCLALSGFPQHIAQGTALCSMVLPSMFGSTQHHLRGNVMWQVAPFLSLGALFGGVSGGFLAVLLPEHVLRGVFSSGLATIGLRYILS
eukprot:GGOE01003654.1.p1 GENE.GGOE01003654.1~~GGOE01003654.1.p1  ORF type:complete len:343 (+),score=52.73 GGOE01003654.1:97-1125(+)